MKLALILALALSAAACGDDSPAVPSDSPMPPGDGSGSGSGSGDHPTLTSYVIDLVMHHTTATETAHAYSEFSTLPDPDGTANNVSAYASLF